MPNVIVSSDIDTFMQAADKGAATEALGLNQLTTVSAAYVVVATDRIVLQTEVFGVTLLTAVGRAGRVFTITNGSSGNITISTTSSQTISGASTVTLIPNESLDVYSDGTNWRVK